MSNQNVWLVTASRGYKTKVKKCLGRKKADRICMKALGLGWQVELRELTVGSFIVTDEGRLIDLHDEMHVSDACRFLEHWNARRNDYTGLLFWPCEAPLPDALKAILVKDEVESVSSQEVSV